MPAALLCLVALAPPAESAAVDPASAPLPAPRVLADGVRVWSNFAYRTVDGESLRMDLVLPPRDETQPAPPRTALAVYVHGGGWVAGSKRKFQYQILDSARRGTAAAAIEYRLSRVGRRGRTWPRSRRRWRTCGRRWRFL